MTDVSFVSASNSGAHSASGKRGSRSDLIIALALALLVIVLHRSALDEWWLYDDPQIVLHAKRNGAVPILFSPEAYRFLAAHTFTPLLSISFKLDLGLAGLTPRFFYAHQLASLAIATVLFFFLLRRYVSRLGASIAIVAFVSAPPTVLVVHTLMMRHYLEGLVLALGAMLLWTGSGSRASGWATALLYLLAMIAKEVYAPLPLLMLAHEVGRGARGREMVTRMVPIATAAALFVIWRGVMLGSLGGYEDLPHFTAILRTPIVAVNESFRGSPAWLVLASLITVSILLVSMTARAGRKVVPTAIAMLLFALLPIMPLVLRFEPRYAFVAFVTLLAAATLATRWSVLPGRLPVVLLALFAILSGIAGVYQLRAFRNDSAAMRTEGRFIWKEKPTAPVLLASSPGWYLDGIRELREAGGSGGAPRFILGREAVVLEEVSADHLVSSKWGTEELRPLDATARKEIASERERLDTSIPIRVVFRREKHAIRWNAEPGSGGTWTFLTYPFYGRYPISSSGWNRIPDSRARQFFRVRRDLPDGRWSITPVLELPTEGHGVEWSRAGA